MARARHHTDVEGLRRIRRQRAIQPARADVPVNWGVHVETEPFGSTKPGLGGPRAETGAYREGAYVEFDLPAAAIVTHVGPRHTTVIPTFEPLQIDNLDPTYVFVKQGWNLWYFWR